MDIVFVFIFNLPDLMYQLSNACSHISVYPAPAEWQNCGLG
uniref:Uncharacterized protein n=1 Tax=Anguilla anguilla TaxID=7936 RepID=A0A0E9V913_ANGAN